MNLTPKFPLRKQTGDFQSPYASLRYLAAAASPSPRAERGLGDEVNIWRHLNG